MNIKVPSGLKSPTVIIVGNKEPDTRTNDLHARRLDYLEKKLDDHYKRMIEKTDNSKLIKEMQSSFMDNFNKLLSMNKSMMTNNHKEKISALRDEFARKIKSIEDDKDNEVDVKAFTSKLSSLETSIKNITLKPQIVKVGNNNNKALLNSFDGILQKMEAMIKASRPRLIPSPS